MDKIDKDIKEGLDIELSSIIVTNELKEKVLLRYSKARRNYNRKIAVLGIGIVLTLILVLSNGNKVVSAIGPIAKYIPGINTIIYDLNNNNTYALDGTIRAEYADKYIEIMSCFTEGNVVKAVVHSNIVFEKEEYITAIDKKERKGDLISKDIIGEGETESKTYSWIGAISFQFNNVVDTFDLKIGEYEIPVIMTKIDSVQDFEDYGNVSYRNRLWIAAFTEYVDDLLEVKLIGLSDDAREIQLFANNEIYLNDQQGNRYFPLNSPQNRIVPDNTYYFQARLRDGLKIIIPYVTLIEKDNSTTNSQSSEQTINVPDDYLNLDQTFKLGEYSLSIVRIERVKNQESVIIRTPDGKSEVVSNPDKNGLRIIVDKKYQDLNSEGIYDFSCSYDSKYGPSLVEVNGKKVYYNDAGKASNQEYDESSYKVIYLQNVPLETESLKITFERPVFIRKGPWEINLKK